jgi:hypothetical protein
MRRIMKDHAGEGGEKGGWEEGGRKRVFTY